MEVGLELGGHLMVPSKSNVTFHFQHMEGQEQSYYMVLSCNNQLLWGDHYIKKATFWLNVKKLCKILLHKSFCMRWLNFWEITVLACLQQFGGGERQLLSVNIILDTTLDSGKNILVFLGMTFGRAMTLMHITFYLYFTKAKFVFVSCTKKKPRKKTPTKKKQNQTPKTPNQDKPTKKANKTLLLYMATSIYFFPTGRNNKLKSTFLSWLTRTLGDML